jgi:3-hydroxyacyl-CoA dehydrogenase/enoyl-CoA hydratase/3-hydroxybutyryl-CoA epimerase
MSDAPTLYLEKREDRIAILWMDDPNAPVNTLKHELIEQFESVLTEVENDGDLEVLVFASGKPEGFIAGADLHMLKDVATPEQARLLSQMAQGLNNRLARLRPRSVAAIHGACLGGGLELVLALDCRVASNDHRTRIGLPEVQLGLLPGGGGTQRLPALIGAERALDLLLTGRHLSAKRARHVGIVDELVPKEILIDAAIKVARSRQQERSRTFGSVKNALSFKTLREWVFTGNPIGRRVLFDQVRKRMLRTTRGNYPAPERILEVSRIGLEQGFEAGLAAEAEAFGELVVSPEAKQLINIFFASNELKKDRGIDDPLIEPRAIHKVGVLGAGLMGAGISYVTITKAQVPVRLKDKDDPGLSHGLVYVQRLLDGRVSKRAMTPLQRAQVLAMLTGTVEYRGFANTDLVIEAVFEDLTLKQRMLRDIEAITDDKTVFASNTSAIPIKEIAAAGQRPENVIGMHYFSPVEKMPLLEIVTTDVTAPWVITTCVELGKRQGKTVIVVNDGPGFYTSRILGPYMNEAVYLLTEGVAIDRIDNALRDFGFPVGPLALLDEVGIDVGNKVAERLSEAFGDRMRPPPGIERLLHDQRLGRKNQRGMYRYGDRKGSAKRVDESVYQLLGVAPSNPLSSGEIAERCALRMVNEAVHCLQEGVVRSPRDGDIGAVFGLGFPPFRGGPFRYLDQSGVKAVASRLEQLNDQHGGRYDSAPLLLQKAREGRGFYDF